MCLCSLVVLAMVTAYSPDIDPLPASGVEVSIPKSPDLDQVHLTVPFDGGDVRLELQRISLRGPDFTVEIHGDETILLRDHDLPRPNTFRGRAVDTSSEVSIGDVAASRHPDGRWSALVKGPMGAWALEPQGESTLSDGQHLLYRREDIEPTGPASFCAGVSGLDSLERDGAEKDYAPLGDSELYLAEVAFDADFPYFRRLGSDVIRVVRDIELIMNGVDAIYRRDVSIAYEITHIIVRSTPAQDPYTGPTAGILLNEFQDHWNTHHTHISRDTAHLMTDRNVGNYGGLARLGVLCRLERAYAFSRSKLFRTLPLRVQLTAHELGHNWRAQHCDNDPLCSVMCATVGGCTSSDRFESTSIQSISDHRDTRTCLDRLSPSAPFPWFDAFDGEDFDTSRWSYHRGVELLDDREDAPSGRRVARLDATERDVADGDDLRTNTLDLTVSQDPYLTFYSLPQHAPAGGELQIDAYHPELLWHRLATIVADGSKPTEYTFHRLPLAPEFRWAGFRLRFRAETPASRSQTPRGGRISSDWSLDDIQIRDGGISHTLTPLLLGKAARLDARGANPGDFAVFFVSLSGLGDGPCFQGTCLELAWPVLFLNAQLADAQGVASTLVTVPPYLDPGPVYAQVLVTDGVQFTTSHPVVTEVE